MQDEFDYLIGLGHDPKDTRTQLHAARSAFGPVDLLERVNPRPRETHNETGGRGDHSDPDTRKDGSPKGMSAELRSDYQRRIDMGIYKGWDDPQLVTELKDFGDGTIRNRAARSRAA